MRKLIAVFSLLMLLALPRAEASISNMVAQLGLYNSTDSTYGLEVDNNNQFHFSQTGAGIWYGINSVTTENTLTANQTGQTFVSTAAFGTISGDPTLGSGTIILVLPTAQKGMDFTYIAGTTEKIQLIPGNSGDTIQYSTLTAGQSLYNSTAAKGDHIEVKSNAAGSWQINDLQGTWTNGKP